MHKIAKNSTKAIIFVIIYIFFIFFISLFKGINLYDIKLPYISISHLFIKINKKITLDAENINIHSSDNYQKLEFNLHKEFYLFTKILPFFNEIKLKNFKYNNQVIFKQIYLNKNNFYIYSKDLTILGEFNVKSNVSYVKINTFRYKNIVLNNSSIIFYYTPKYIAANVKFTYLKNPVYFSLFLKKSTLIHTASLKNFYFKIKNKKIYFKNCNLKGKININNFNYSEKLQCSNISIKYKKYSLFSHNNNIKLTNKYIYICSDKGNLEYKNYDLNLSKYELYYEPNKKNMMLYAKKDTIKYKNYLLQSEKLTLNYNFNTKSLFLHTINLSANANNTDFFSKELLVYKNKKTTYFFNDNKIKNKYFIFTNQKIKGNLQKITFSNIIGKIFNIESTITSLKINLKKKQAFSNKITLNNIIFFNNKIFFSKKPYVFKTQTHTLLDKNLKNLLKKFTIIIPITQIKGNNDINLTFSTNLKNFNINYIINSNNSLFKINNFQIPFSYKKLYINGNKFYSHMQIFDFNFPYRFLNCNFDSNISINIKDKYLNSFINIKKLNIDKYLEIKNFHEKVVLNLINKYMFLLNSAIFINLNNKTIYFYDLKRLLKYSPFKEIFNNGKSIIKILNNKIAIFVNSTLNYPIILNEKNPKKIKANILISKNDITINSNNKIKKISVNIKNLSTLKATIKNIDIDTVGLMNIVKSVKKIIKKINTNNAKPVNFKAFVKGYDTNFTYKNHKFITQKATFEYNKEFKFNAIYGKSILNAYTKNGYLIIKGKNYNTKTLIPLLSFFKHFNSLDIDFTLIHAPENFYTGNINIHYGVVGELKALNNLIAFINTIPAILTLQKTGFSSKGYIINKGNVKFFIYNDILYFKTIKIQGSTMNFDGKGYINLKNNYCKIKINVIIKLDIKKIPLIGRPISYLLFGKNRYLNEKVVVEGNINNPTIKHDLGIGLETPFILFKRILTLPFNTF